MTVKHSGAVVATHYQYHVGRLSGIFFKWKCAQRFLQEKKWRTHSYQALKGKSFVIVLLPNVSAFPRQIHHEHCPCQYAWIEAHLFGLYFLTFQLALPSWKPHWSCWPIDLSWHREFTLPVFFLGKRVCEKWRHRYAMQTKCWAHWCHVLWRSYV